jgi:hypothetical protein
MRISEALRARLSRAEVAALERLLAGLDELLPRIYREALIDYQESRGDDAALYGLRVYKHLRFALTTFADRDPDIMFLEPNGSYVLAVGPLRLRVDSLGHFVNEDVLGCFPDNSPTKQAVGRRNLLQLRFEMPEADPVPDQAAFNLNALTAGHFGNPSEGLVKWYLGAWTETETGGRTWVWIERQDEDRGEQAAPLAPRVPIVPFNERAADIVSVQPRRSA